jgi:Vacuolar-sorting associated protein 13, adaptor binding domain
MSSRWSKPISLDAVGMTGQLELLERHHSTNRQGQTIMFCLGVSVELAPAPFQRTKMITFSPRFILVNKLEQSIFYQQVNEDGDDDMPTRQSTFLENGERLPWHWPLSKTKRDRRFLSIRCVFVVQACWRVSGCVC